MFVRRAVGFPKRDPVQERQLKGRHHRDNNDQDEPAWKSTSSSNELAISPEMRSKSKMRPLTASSDGCESRRWRMISERPQDAGNEHGGVPHESPRVIGIENGHAVAGPRIRELDVAFFDPSYTGRAGLGQFC